jgi:hypothetical protein
MPVITDVVKLTRAQVVCHCYHLTEFSGVEGSAMPKMNLVDPTNPGLHLVYTWVTPGFHHWCACVFHNPSRKSMK